jgi:hypothetical protein
MVFGRCRAVVVDLPNLRWFPWAIVDRPSPCHRATGALSMMAWVSNHRLGRLIYDGLTRPLLISLVNLQWHSQVVIDNYG